ncbi:MAG: DUF6155 family protein [Bacteroidales bacterium]|nr:DUF6155 family protein [Bacteroidales bacterium]
MSKAALKKQLNQLTKEQVIEVVLELYEARKEAKEYLEFYLNPNENEKLEEYKKIICEEFYPTRVTKDPQTRFSVCRKAISDFKKLKPNPLLLGELMVYYIELGCQFTYDYGDMWEQYYDAICRNFDKTMDFLSKNKLIEEFKPRIKQCLRWASVCGWGFPDEMNDIYYNYTEGL